MTKHSNIKSNYYSPQIPHVFAWGFYVVNTILKSADMTKQIYESCFLYFRDKHVRATRRFCGQCRLEIPLFTYINARNGFVVMKEDVEKSALRVKFLFFICSLAFCIFRNFYHTPFSFLYLSIIYMLTKKPHPKNVIKKFTSLDNKNRSKI